MSARVVAVVAAVVVVMVLGGIIVWVAGGDGSPRTAALEESRRSSAYSWHLFGGAASGGSGQTFWADLEAVAGCDAQGQVATVQASATGDAGKHVSEVAPSACRLEVAVNARVNSALYAWINGALSETHTRKDLTLFKRPYEGGSQGDLGISLEDVLIERVELPAFQNVTGAPPATVTLTVRPEQTIRDNSPGVGSPPSGLPAPVPARYFGVNLHGEQLSASRFEPWSAAVEITRDAGASDFGDPVYTATETSLGDLGLSIALSDSAAVSDANHLHDWFQDLVIQSQGAPDPSEERTLTFTARPQHTGATPLLTVTFTNVGIFAQPSYALGNDPEKFLLYAEGASFAGASP